ncbi:Abscisic acid receptor pyl3 [Castilleja foliolosa]|uniref:Abscisic acid receptor pyl3 n=1 Tax=Castilleja foliolosa TaxID=1961234 RepID=A0ABD3D974_9LAMI
MTKLPSLKSSPTFQINTHYPNSDFCSLLRPNWRTTSSPPSRWFSDDSSSYHSVAARLDLTARWRWGWFSWSSGLNYGIRAGGPEEDFIRRYHKHDVREDQCTSSLVKHIKAPLPLVWSLVMKFDEPQIYKPFVSRCVVNGDMQIGTVREVNVKSGLPATVSKERLELLDDEEHILSMRIVGGDHRLKNYSSIITVHPEIIDGRPGILVIESFVVDVPEGNTKDETCYFVEVLIKCNLASLADISEDLAMQDQTEPIDIV